MEALAERIRKLLARGNDKTGATTEGEALQAIRVAHKLLTEHGLKLQDVVGSRSSLGDFIIDDDLITSSAKHWRRDLAANVARLYFCDYTFSFVRKSEPQRKDRKYRRLDRHSFYGRAHNVAVAKGMFVYLVDTIERLAEEARKNRRESATFETEFQKGCADRIIVKLSEKWFDATHEPETALIAGNKLPALYKQNDAELEEFMAGKQMEQAKDRSLKRNHHGELAGWVAGSDVSLDTQIENSKPEGLIEHG